MLINTKFEVEAAGLFEATLSPCANESGLDLYIKERQERQLLAVCGGARMD